MLQSDRTITKLRSDYVRPKSVFVQAMNTICYLTRYKHINHIDLASTAISDDDQATNRVLFIYYKRVRFYPKMEVEKAVDEGIKIFTIGW